jgi:hypothetical protein
MFENILSFKNMIWLGLKLKIDGEMMSSKMFNFICYLFYLMLYLQKTLL